MNFVRTAILLLFFVAGSAFLPKGYSFEESQKTNERVRKAYSEKEDFINTRCHALGIPEETFGNMFIRVFKQEAIMEIWVQKPDGKYGLFRDFKIYAESGDIGPKKIQGDCQVPEGYYYINEYNPFSNYHLSLGISYPNETDMKLFPANRKGGLIYIHGATASAGCLAMSDFYIEDIYICAIKAKSNGQQKIPVQIFPFRPTESNMAYFTKQEQYKKYSKFWANLAEGYQFFEKNNRLPVVKTSSNGYYQFFDPTYANSTSCIDK